MPDETFEQRLQREHLERRRKFFPAPPPPRYGEPPPDPDDIIEEVAAKSNKKATIGAAHNKPPVLALRDPLSFNGGFVRQRVVQTVARHYGFTVAEIMDHDKGQRFVYVRAVIAYLLRTRFHMSYSLIARALDRDHSSIYHLIHLIETRHASEQGFQQVVSDLACIARQNLEKSRHG